MKQILPFLVLFLFFSCEEKVSQNGNRLFFGEVNTYGQNERTLLNINARFSECGEWGGNKENLKIFVKNKNIYEQNKEIYLEYIKIKMDCGTSEKMTQPKESVENTKTILLNDENLNAITEYIEKMVNSKRYEEFPGHAGNSFSVYNSDSTLVVRNYSNDSKNERNFRKLMSKLNL